MTYLSAGRYGCTFHYTSQQEEKTISVNWHFNFFDPGSSVLQLELKILTHRFLMCSSRYDRDECEEKKAFVEYRT
jgi:hypothetical protein